MSDSLFNKLQRNEKANFERLRPRACGGAKLLIRNNTAASERLHPPQMVDWPCRFANLILRADMSIYLRRNTEMYMDELKCGPVIQHHWHLNVYASRLLYVLPYCANDLLICLETLSENTTGMHLGKLDGFYVRFYICIIYEIILTSMRWCLITHLWNVCSQPVSTSVRCIGGIPWEIKCKGVENKWAISVLAGTCWPSLKRQAFFRILWAFLFASFGTSWRRDFTGVLFQQFMDSVLFHLTLHRVPGIYSRQLVSQFS